MSDFEIDQIRRIRRQISREHDHDLGKIAEHYRRLEEELRVSGQFRFADQVTHQTADEDGRHS